MTLQDVGLQRSAATPATLPIRRGGPTMTSDAVTASPKPRVVYDTDMLLLEGLSGYSQETLAAAREIATLIDKAERLGDAHTRLEEDENVSSEQQAEAERVWQDARDEAAAAALALLSEHATGADATTRLTVYLRERCMFATPRKSWRPVTAAEAIERISDAIPGSENDLAPALAFAMNYMVSASDPEMALERFEWDDARAAYLTAVAAYEAAEGASDEILDPLWNAMAAALKLWEGLPPPDTNALAELIGASLQFDGMNWNFQHVDDPRTLRDMLDGGDAHEQLVARVYLHLLRLAGSQSQALTTPPIGCLFPAFRASDFTHAGMKSGELEAAWVEHHGTAEPHPSRIQEFATWRMPRLKSVHGEGVQQDLRYRRALDTFARKLIADYEALGGAFSVHREPDGDIWSGTRFPPKPSARSREIEGIVATHDAVRRAIDAVLMSEEGPTPPQRG